MKVDTSFVEIFSERVSGVDAAVWSDDAHDTVVAEYRRQQAQIPKDTGALRKAILRRSDRKHRWTTTGDEARLEIDLPQAKYQGHRLPTPDAQTVAEAIAEAIDNHLTGA